MHQFMNNSIICKLALMWRVTSIFHPICMFVCFFLCEKNALKTHNISGEKKYTKISLWNCLCDLSQIKFCMFYFDCVDTQINISIFVFFLFPSLSRLLRLLLSPSDWSTINEWHENLVNWNSRYYEHSITSHSYHIVSNIFG